jgi:hypothetical protein
MDYRYKFYVWAGGTREEFINSHNFNNRIFESYKEFDLQVQPNEEKIFNTNRFTPRPGFNLVESGEQVNYFFTNKEPTGPYFYYINAHHYVLGKIDIWAWESPIKNKKLYIPDNVRHDVLEGRCRIILDHSMEGFHRGAVSKEKWLNFLGDYREHCIYLAGDANLSFNDILPCGYRNMWEKSVAYSTVQNNQLDWYQNEQALKVLSAKPRKFKGIHKSRLLRAHRIFLTYLLDRGRLHKDINYSLGLVTHHGSNDHNARNYNEAILQDKVRSAEIAYKLDYSKIMSWLIDHGEKNLWHESDGNTNLHINQASVTTRALHDAHLDAYFEIVSETNFRSGTTFHSEKTFKAIVHYHPFLINGECGMIQKLREFGYDVFDDIIDHTYDTIRDDRKRVETLYAEIHRLCKKTHTEWAELLRSLYPRLEKNYYHLLQSYWRHNTFHEPVYKNQVLEFPSVHK